MKKLKKNKVNRKISQSDFFPGLDLKLNYIGIAPM